MSPFHEQTFSAEIPEHEIYDELNANFHLSTTEELPKDIIAPSRQTRDVVDQSKYINSVYLNDEEAAKGSLKQKRALVFRPLFV